ncbi:Myosin head (motor domain) family protein [Leishmania donovani]|uniref:Myosin head (Motor domain) family protein n=1 Tax=Leishmania donovani TaxID=5661 RepID=A0A504XIS9_LEIDO|nr:Myosin head (motor domain) family protein [Leishmania donovani]
MSITGEARYASSPHSAISVSSSSLNATSSSTSPSQLVEYPGRRGSGSGILDDEGVSPRARSPRLYADRSVKRRRQFTDGRHHQLLVYVAPSTTRQFVSVSSAQAYLLRNRSASRGHLLSTTENPEDDACAHQSALRGGHWCIAYEVDASWRAAVSACSDTEAASTPFSPVRWCFTLEPLPAEQLAMCRAALWACISVSSGTAAADHTPPRQCATASSRPTASQDWMLHDILVTPLYVCVNAAAVVPLNTSADLLLVRRVASGGVPADAAEVMAAASAALEVLLRESPTCGALVYALLQQQRQRTVHDTVASPLSILDSSACIFAEGSDFTQYEEALAADVYVSAVPSLPAAPPSTRLPGTRSPAETTQLVTSPSAPPEEEGGNAFDHSFEAWAAKVSQHLLRRWARLPSQTVLCCGERQATLRHRRGLVLRHAADVRGSTTPASATQSDSYVRRLRAALYLLDALRPVGSLPGRHICDRGEANSSVVVDALEVVLEECEEDGRRCEPPELQRRYRFLRGRARRVAAFAPAAALGWLADGSRFIPEPDYLQLPWCAAHAAALTLTAAQVHATSSSTPSHAHVSLAELDACMDTLQFTAEQQTGLHELAYSVLYLASLTFTSQRGSSGGPAAVSSNSLPALSAAAQLLRLPASELVAALTTVAAREGVQSTSVATRHALNCAGAMQMQRTLVAHLGGLVVRTLMYLINAALHVDGRVAAEARTLTLAATADIEDTAGQEQHAHMPDAHGERHEGCGCGLTKWYAAYVRCHASMAVRDRLVGALQREACYEGVELEVDSWLDELSAASTAPITTALRLGRVAAEVREIATRVMMPSAKQRGKGIIVTPHTAAGAYDFADTTCDIPVLSELAHILEAVTSRCIGVDVSAAPPLSSPEAVQCILTEQLQALAASARQATASEVVDTAMRAAEVVCTWEGTASADSTMQQIIGDVSKRCASWTSAGISPEALQSILAHRHRSRSSIANIAMNVGHRDDHTASLASDFWYVILAVPVLAETASWGSLPDAGDLDQHQRSSPGAYPFLEPVLPHEAPVPPTPAPRVAMTRDDALATHLHERDPLLLALFFCSATVEGRETFLSESTARTVTDSASSAPVRTPRLRMRAMAPDDAAAEFLNRVRHLQRQARHRELCLLALTEVPCCSDGGVVLGVSAVFLRSAAVAAIRSCCAELSETAVRSSGSNANRNIADHCV